jgi:YidC/Oxa1 family membrane protein insertase
MELYKENEINPLSGCLPIFLQIPVFFALYKVLFISIEMRGADFIWWIQDLSLKDPTSLFNMFGLLPFSVPSFLQIGVLPILMELTTFTTVSFS